MYVRQVDIAIIGAPSAGMRVYREETQYTDSVVLIEDGPTNRIFRFRKCWSDLFITR